MAQLLLIFALFHISFIGFCRANGMLGPGMWSLISISKCPNEDELPEIRASFDVDKHRLNRTHDGLNVNVYIKEDLTDQYAVLIEICKYVDGGCKPYHVISDDSLANFLNKHSRDNVVTMLQMVRPQLESDDFPVPLGNYTVENFVVNYCTLPRDAVYGKFEATSYIIHGSIKVGCVFCVVEFNELTEEKYCEE